MSSTAPLTPQKVALQMEKAKSQPSESEENVEELDDLEIGEELDGFHGVYLLISENPMRPGGTYIGYTVNPNRRIAQHNKGRDFGGAKKTSDKGPWSMVLIVHGFPSSIAALGFEWAWQNPHRSKRLRSFFEKNNRSLKFCLSVMWKMLILSPWCRLPLIVRWLRTDLTVMPPAGSAPPPHVAITEGKVEISKKNKMKGGSLSERLQKKISLECSLCSLLIRSQPLTCLNEDCRANYHVICLAKEFLKNEPDQILPIEGACPSCNYVLVWGELINNNGLNKSAEI